MTFLLQIHSKSLYLVCQSLNYTSDLESTGYEEYPVSLMKLSMITAETVKITAILSAAILQEMGSDVVLLELPEHMALEIKCGHDQKVKVSSTKAGITIMVRPLQQNTTKALKRKNTGFYILLKHRSSIIMQLMFSGLVFQC